MKKIIFLLALLFTISQASAFTDIENNWYKQSITELKDLEIINGFDNGTFLPEDNIWRAEVLKIILSASELEIVEPEEKCFSDVNVSSWQAKYICSGVEKGITKGYENGTFKPSGTVSVLETLAFGARAFELDIPEGKEGEEWYKKYQDFAHENNIMAIHSYTINTLISRGQAAELINKMKKFADGEKVDYKSIGCTVNPNLQSGSYTAQVNGKTRTYLLYVPSWISKWKETKLAVAFHGRTNSNEMVRDYMQLGGWKYGGKQNDFIVAYPAAQDKPSYSWSQYEHIEFFDAIVTEVSEKLCVDRDAVFSVGHSLGSYMSNKVSCQRWDVIRAMAWVASDGFRGECSGPVSSLITHLPEDPLAWYSWWLRAFKIRGEVNLCWTEEKSTSIWDIKSCSEKLSCTSWNTVMFCNSYATYWSDQHSRPKNWSDDILDFFREIDDYGN